GLRPMRVSEASFSLVAAKSISTCFKVRQKIARMRSVGQFLKTDGGHQQQHAANQQKECQLLVTG
ncbi:MAG: hypothetical protein K0U29_08355, partial [Gammaproteobacteria bacterium]|nr:hypothetical protein [Gammaproteobacteria bacterium]